MLLWLCDEKSNTRETGSRKSSAIVLRTKSLTFIASSEPKSLATKHSRRSPSSYRHTVVFNGPQTSRTVAPVRLAVGPPLAGVTPNRSMATRRRGGFVSAAGHSATTKAAAESTSARTGLVI